MALAVLRPLAFGEIVDQAFGLYRRCFVPLFVVSLVCSGLPVLLNLVVESRGGFLAASGIALLALVLSVIGGAFANGASTFIVSEQYLGRSLSAGDALARAQGRIGGILATTITVGLLTGIGLILLVVPGFIAMSGFALAVTICALEGLDSAESRSRSWELTRGHRWQMLGLLFLYGVILWILILGVGVLAGITGGIASGDPASVGRGGFGLLISAIGSLLTLAVNPLLYCIVIVAYYDLRVRKEAFDLDLLASTLEHSAVPR